MHWIILCVKKDCTQFLVSLDSYVTVILHFFVNIHSWIFFTQNFTSNKHRHDNQVYTSYEQLFMIVLLCLVVHWMRMKFKFPSLGANHSLMIGSLEVVTSSRLEALSLSLVLKSSCRAWLWVSGNSRARSPPTIVTVPNMTRGRFCRSFACNVVVSMCKQELLPEITYSHKDLDLCL